MTTKGMVPGANWNKFGCSLLGVPSKYHLNSNTYWADVAADVQENTRKWKHKKLSVFGRATVCSVFIAANIFYVLQILHCAHLRVQKVHRVFTLLKGYKPMRRDNLFRSIKSGGLSLTHLFVSQLASRFLFLCDQRHPFLLKAER